MKLLPTFLMVVLLLMVASPVTAEDLKGATIESATIIPLKEGTTVAEKVDISLDAGKMVLADKVGDFSVETTATVDGSPFVPTTSSVTDGNLLWTDGKNGEIDSTIDFKYAQYGSTIKETVTLKEDKELTFPVKLQPDTQMIPWFNGQWKIVSSTSGDTMAGIIAEKPYGIDAAGRYVEMAYEWDGSSLILKYDRVAIVPPKNFAEKPELVPITYPLVIDPTWTLVGSHYQTTSGSYTIEKFNTTGTSYWVVPDGVTSIQYIVVGGGGGGSPNAGGGAGGFRSSVASETSGGGASSESALTVKYDDNLTIIVGAEGAGSAGYNFQGTSGGDSKIINQSATPSAISVISTGGGAGGRYSSCTPAAKTGGSGGGGSGTQEPSDQNCTPAAGTANQGYAGGYGYYLNYHGGGGGGSGSVGANATASNGGNGGTGDQSSITGEALWYAGGGAGGVNVGTVGTGGSSVGGNGGGGGATPTAGTAGTGSGGGGNGGPELSGASGAGGNGVVILRYTVGAGTKNIANFTASDTTPPVGEVVTFYNWSTINDTENLFYLWDFGDSYTSNTQGNVTHIYSWTGIFTVNLSIMSHNNSWANMSRVEYITVSSATESYAESNTTSLQTAPQFVDIYLKTWYGQPIPNGTVVLTPLSTSTGSWDWLLGMLGLGSGGFVPNESAMGQTTDIFGKTSFFVLPTTKYNIHISAPGYTFDEGDFIPSEDDYTFRAHFLGTDLFTSGYDEMANIKFMTNGTEINTTHGRIHVEYTDLLAQTTSATVLINTSSSVGNTTTYTTVASYTDTSGGNFTHDFDLAGTRGNSYQVVLQSTGSTFSSVIRTFGVLFKPGPMSLGIPEGLLVYVGMFGLIFISLCFVRTLPGPAVIVVMFFAWIFYFMGWWRDLSSEWIVIGALTFYSAIAILFNIMLRSKKQYYE